MTCCKKEISIFKGFGTKWDNIDLILVSFDSEIDIDGFGAEFYIGDIVKTYENIQDGFAINLTAQETETLPLGATTGTLVLVDLENNKHPFSTELPFLVKDWEDGDIKLDGFNITIGARVEDNKLNIKIETSNPEKINEETIRGYISVHNNSEEAHPYIQGLISAEKERAETAEQSLESGKADKSTSLEGYGITNAYTKSQTDSTFATKTELTTGLSEKQNTISDLATIRSNASAGKTASDTIARYGNVVTHNVNEFATAAQGAKADSAVQPSQLSSVATSGSYNDLNNKPTIGNGILTLQKNGESIGSFTANSTVGTIVNITVPTTASDIGALPDTTKVNDISTVTQKNAINSGATVGSIAQITTNKNAIGDLESLQTSVKSDLVNAINEVDAYTVANTSNISVINSKIPNQASSTNQLADKNFVNSSIATNTANFIGTFDSVEALNDYSGPVTNNDYAFVIGTTSTSIVYNRYKYSTAVNPPAWLFEYSLNNSSFTEAEWTAINSGITPEGVEQITTNQEAIGNLESLTTDDKTDLVSAINEVNAVSITAVQPEDLAQVAFSGSYEDLSDTPNINDATLTIQKNGSTVATFTANSDTNKTANITVPTQPSDIGAVAANTEITGGTKCKITYDSKGLVTNGENLNQSDIITALGYTPYNSTNPAGYTTNVGTVTSVNNVSPVNGDVSLSIPTVYDSTITIQKNGTNVDSFTTNASSNKSINITVPTQASDVNALPSSTKYGADLSLTSDTLQLLDQDGNNLGNSVSLPDPSLKANVGLDNLTSTGKNIGNWSSNVTNCITSIPQDIKLELNDGTLTLKAGSKVYVPNGFEQDGTTPKFDTVTFQNDVLCYDGYTTAGVRLMTYLNTEGQLPGVVTTFFNSGDTTKMNSTTAYDYARFYNTTTNKMYRGNGSNVWVEVYQSLPIAIATNDSSGKYTLNQTFNGFGYMGSTIFALPGIKGLIPNGRNADGTLKNEEITINEVRTRTFTTQTKDYVLGISQSNISVTEGYTYNEKENLNYSGSVLWGVFVVGNISLSSGVVTYFKTNQTFRAIDYNDMMKPGMLMPYAGSQAPTGWLICDGSAVSRTIYSDLFSVIGTTYGSGDGGTTFNIPNFINKTFWGGTTSTSGTVKSAGLPNITGTVSRILTGTSSQGSNVAAGTGAFSNMSAAAVSKDATASSAKWWNDNRTLNFNASKSNSIYGNSTTVQPPAIQTLIIIKY